MITNDVMVANAALLTILTLLDPTATFNSICHATLHSRFKSNVKLCLHHPAQILYIPTFPVTLHVLQGSAQGLLSLIIYLFPPVVF